VIEAAQDLERERAGLQETMSLLAALAANVEASIGRPANAMAFVAGKKLGQRFAADVPPTDDLEAALEQVGKVLHDNDCMWHFETWKPTAQRSLVTAHQDGGEEVMLVFRDCMIRQSLFRYGHAQKGSLCYMMYGFFSGALEKIMGRRSELEIVHAGENACLKRLKIKAK
jgi:predicted hydrocarbon binding protein